MSLNEEEPYKLSQKDNDDTETSTKQSKAILNDCLLFFKCSVRFNVCSPGPLYTRPGRFQTGMKLELIVSMHVYLRPIWKSQIFWYIPFVCHCCCFTALCRVCVNSLKCTCVCIHSVLDSSRSDSQLGPAGAMTSDRFGHFWSSCKHLLYK